MEAGKIYKILLKGENEPMTLEYEFTEKNNPDKNLNGHWFKLDNFNESRIISEGNIIKIEEIKE